MKWKRFTIQTKPEAEDLIADLLLSIGITGAEIRDRTQVLTDEEQQLFEEVMPRQEADDGLAEIVFYLDEDEDAASDDPPPKPASDGIRFTSRIFSGGVPGKSSRIFRTLFITKFRPSVGIRSLKSVPSSV